MAGAQSQLCPFQLLHPCCVYTKKRKAKAKALLALKPEAASTGGGRPIIELELELILSQMAQKPMLRGEVPIITAAIWSRSSALFEYVRIKSPRARTSHPFILSPPSAQGVALYGHLHLLRRGSVELRVREAACGRDGRSGRLRFVRFLGLLRIHRFFKWLQPRRFRDRPPSRGG